MSHGLYFLKDKEHSEALKHHIPCELRMYEIQNSLFTNQKDEINLVNKCKASYLSITKHHGSTHFDHQF